jgi:hypothetical protein
MPVRPAGRRRLRWFIGAASLLVAGCASTGPAVDTSQPSVLIAVQVAGGAKPTPDQSAKVFAEVAAELAAAGYRIAERTDTADFEVVAILTPDAIDATKGSLKVGGVHPILRPSDSNGASFADQLKAARDRQNDLDNWARTREAPAYSIP